MSIPRNYSEARKKSNQKWDAANLDRISLALPKGYKDRLKEHTEQRSESVNAFIKRAIDNQIEQDNEKGEA